MGCRNRGFRSQQSVIDTKVPKTDTTPDIVNLNAEFFQKWGGLIAIVISLITLLATRK